jgi:hypothetical protein
MKTLVLTLCALLTLPAAAAMYKYSELMIKDYDEMHRLVEKQIAKSHDVGSDAEDGSGDDAKAVEHLREALKLIFSRPNSDNMVAKLTPEVRRELTGYAAYADTISSLTAEALAVLKNDKGAPSVQATAIFMLENILSEIRPEAVNNEDLRRVIERVRDAKIKIPSDVTKNMKLRAMFTAKNPSETATQILKTLPPIKKTEPKKSEPRSED